jgi:hypothetical protein
MGILYERGMEQLQIEDYEEATQPRLDPNRNVPDVQQLIQRHRQIQSKATNEQLKLDLLEQVGVQVVHLQLLCVHVYIL